MGQVLCVRKRGDGAEEAWELWTWTLVTGVSGTELHPPRTQHQDSQPHLGLWLQNRKALGAFTFKIVIMGINPMTAGPSFFRLKKHNA